MCLQFGSIVRHMCMQIFALQLYSVVESALHVEMMRAGREGWPLGTASWRLTSQWPWLHVVAKVA